VNRSGIAFLATALLLAMACQEARRTGIVRGTYAYHDTSHVMLMTFEDDNRVRWRPSSGPSFYLVVGDTVFVQGDTVDGSRALRFLVKVDSLVGIDLTGLDFVRTR